MKAFWNGPFFPDQSRLVPVQQWTMIGLLGCLALLNGCASDDPVIKAETNEFVAISKSIKTPVLIHYMPWFETPASNKGRWGIHWTMANRDPEKIVDASTGRREIASHFYPLIGPYASSDPDVLEYQVLLMKIAGIDGVVVDWYGTSSHADYPQLNNNVEALFNLLPTAGLKFAFVYEDQSVKHALDAGVISVGLDQGKADMRWMGSYFKSPDYIRLGSAGQTIGQGRPLLMTFGPQYFQTPVQWQNILGELPEAPDFLTLWYESGEVGNSATGEFAWIYQDARPYTSHLSDFYSRAAPGGTRMGIAFPGFRDFYSEGGWGNDLFFIDHKETATFEGTLHAALDAGGPVQLATWNDYGEGTMLEPTVEFGYHFLEVLQKTLGVEATPAEFLLAEKLFGLRRKYATDQAIQGQLNKAYRLMVQLKWQEARDLMASVE